MEVFYVPMYLKPNENCNNNNWEASTCVIFSMKADAVHEAARIKCQNPEYAVEVIVVRVREAGIVEV